MAIANSTALQTYQAIGMLNSNVEFITIPHYFSNATPKHYPAYVPVILMDDGYYDDDLRVSVGKSISLESISNEADALEAARISCLSTHGAVGYSIKGVDHE